MKEKREKLENFSSLGIFLANALTAALVLLMWVITHNIWITVGSLILLPFFMMKLFNREVKLVAKIVVALIAAVLFGMFAYFFRYKPVETKPISSDPGTVIVEEDKKDEDEDDTPQVSEQEVIVSPYGNKNGRRKTPTAQERLTPTYSNTGGSSKKGETVNHGEAKVTKEGPANIVDTSESEKKQDEKIQKDVDNGKTKVELKDGIIATTDAKPGDEATTNTSNKDDHKDEKPAVDVTSPNIVDLKPQKEPDPIPAPLPESEQLKKDVKEMSDDELKDILGDVKPTKDTESDTTKTEISSDQKSEESTKPDEGTSKSETETKVDEPKENTPESNKDDKKDQTTPASDQNAQTEVKGEDEKQPKSTNTNTKQEETTPNVTKTEDTTTVVTEKEPVVTPTQPEYTPVSISSLDGSSAYAGDSVQFKVSGDVKSVDGLGGLKYTFAGGYITVDTNPGEATVITPVVTGKDGSTATTSVTVNVLNVQQ